MAIIYNYPLNSILLAEDMLIGTSTKIVNGQPKNATKNFSIGDLTGFIKQNVSLDDVLLVGNTSLLDAKIGSLYLYDTPVADYGNITLNQNRFSFNTVTHGEVFRAQRNMFSSFSSSGYRGSFEVSNITANRVWDFPDKSGTVALLSDMPVVVTPTLQEVTDEGSTTTNSITVSGITSGNFSSDGWSVSISDSNDGIANFYYLPFSGLQIGNGVDLYTQLVNDGSIAFQNSAGYGNLRSDLVTGSWSWQMPNASGTIALTSDISTPTLQQVLDNNHDLVNGNNFQGTGAGVFNTGNQVIGFGTGAVNSNSGVNVNAFGVQSLQANTANNVNGFGAEIGLGNTYKNVNLFGYRAYADANNQNVFSKWISGSTRYLGRLSFNNITTDQKWELPDASGTIALTSNLSGYVPTSRTLTINGTTYDLSANRSWTIAAGVTSVSATSPITSSGGTTPIISTSMATNKLIGRSTAGTGVMEEITIGTGLSLSGGTLSASATGGIPHATATGTDTYTATVTGVTSYADGDAYLIRFTNGNTTGATLNINGLGAISLYRNNDGALIGGDIISGGEMLCVYNSTTNRFQVIGTAPNSLFAYVTNADSVTLTKGMPVYAFGGTGDRMTVKRAYNTGDATSAQTVGLVLSTSIATNQKGLIMIQGLLDGLSILPTSTWTDGDPVYLGATAGTITNVKPYAPNHLVYLGVVTTASNGTAGRMYVRVQNGYELQELHNVDALNPNNNDGIFYNSTTNLWEHKNVLAVAAERRNANNSTNNSINYCGIAPADSLESASVWAITRLTITLAGAVTTASAINVKWTDRETTIYT